MSKFHKLRDTTSTYYTTDNYFFPMMEEKIGEITSKKEKFLRLWEIVWLVPFSGKYSVSERTDNNLFKENPFPA